MPDDAPRPPHRSCGMVEAHEMLLAQHPELRQVREDLEARTRSLLSLTPDFRASGGVITIPVVVHVVYKTDAQKIGMDQVTSQIDALNRDYASKNTDKSKVPSVWTKLVTDTGVQFVLASKDAKGQSTTGVTYTQTTVDAFGTDNKVKASGTGGADAWPRDSYLNLWVCNMNQNPLGYAQFPGGPAATDGVVIDLTCFGTKGTAVSPFNLGRTAVHEVGHWLNLIHIWGDTNDCSGSDQVDDTPTAKDPNYGKPTFPHVTCNNGPNGDMFVNYMDYVDDDTMVMFTAGQVARMHAALDGPRSAIGTGGSSSSSSSGSSGGSSGSSSSVSSASSQSSTSSHSSASSGPGGSSSSQSSSSSSDPSSSDSSSSNSSSSDSSSSDSSSSDSSSSDSSSSDSSSSDSSSSDSSSSDSGSSDSSSSDSSSSDPGSSDSSSSDPGSSDSSSSDSSSSDPGSSDSSSSDSGSSDPGGGSRRKDRRSRRRRTIGKKR